MLVQTLKQIDLYNIKLTKNQLIGFIRNKPDKSIAYKIPQLQR